MWLRPSTTSGDKKLHALVGVGGLTQLAVPTGGKPLLWQKKQFGGPCADVLSLPCSYVSIVLLVRKLVPTWLLLLAGGVAPLSVGGSARALHVTPEKV